MSSVLSVSLPIHAEHTFPSPIPPKIPKMELGPAVIGAGVGFVYDWATIPGSRLITILAVDRTGEFSGMYKTLKYVVRTEGFRGLYRGSTIQMGLGTLGTGVFFYANDKINKALPSNVFTKFGAGALSQCIAAAFWVPCATLLESRFLLESQSKKLFSLSTRELIKHVVINKGLKSCYSAYFPHNIGFMIFNGLGMAASSEAAEWLKDRRGRDLVPAELALVNLFSFGFSATITTPINTVKICQQTASVINTSQSFFKTVKNMYQEGGARRFWKGIVPRFWTLGLRQAVVVSAVQHFMSKRDADSRNSRT